MIFMIEDMLSSLISTPTSLAITYLLIVLHQLLVHCATVDLDWVSSNPLFLASGLRILRRDVRINDRIRFACSQDGSEHVAIHRVSEREAFSCQRLSRFTDALVGTCTKANDSVIIRLREIPMLPNELSYKPNNDYYFISTSTGTPEGLENFNGGLCASQKMRIQIHVNPRMDSTSAAIDRTGTLRSRMPWEYRRFIVGADDSFPSREHIMVLPVDSRQYPVPVMYVPVSASNADLESEDGKRLRLPQHLYIPNGRLQTSLLGNARILDQTGVINDASTDYSHHRPRVIVQHRSDPALTRDAGRSDAAGSDRFDAQDEPFRLFERSDVRGYLEGDSRRGDGMARATALKGNGDENDFEVEYVDSAASRGIVKTQWYCCEIISIFLSIIIIRQFQ